LGVNEHIKKYLDNYISHNDPRFAIMLNGNWGCGKTYFISSYTEEKKENTFIYVSLFGLNKTEQIDEAIFAELHPILSSKGMKILSSVLMAGISKFGFEIKNGGILDGAKIDATLPSINPNSLFTNIVSKILIFDDLERCLIPPTETLGYINKYVEHYKLKVIILANEEEIDESERINKEQEYPQEGYAKAPEREKLKKPSNYKIIREKVIGKSFQIQGDFQETIESFIKNYSEEKGDFPENLIRTNIRIIEDIYKIFKKDNLRILQQTFYDWRIFWNALDERVKEKNDLVKELIRIFFILSFEIKAGLNPDHLHDWKDNYLSFRTNPNKIKNDNYNRFNKFNLSPFDLIVPVEDWKIFFITGVLNEDFNEHLFNTNYFYDEKTPVWQKLFHYRLLSDELFQEYFEILLKELNDKVISDPGVILVISSTLLSLSKNNIYKRNSKKIVKDMKSYITSMASSGYLSNSKWLRIYRDNYNGFGFPDKDNDGFNTIFEFLNQRVKEQLSLAYVQDANNLIQVMKEDSDKFIEEIFGNQGRYYNIPILSYMNVDDFFKALELLVPFQIGGLVPLFTQRYDGVEKYFLTELSFLQKLSILLNKHINNYKPLKKLAMTDLNDKYIKPAIKRLQNINPSN
jgi:hypothetical protein